jgi:hypothetical protein
MMALFAAAKNDAIGPKRLIRNVRFCVAMGGKADVTRAPLDGRS